MSDQLSFLWKHLPDLLIGFPNQRPGGLLLTVLLTAAAVVVGLVAATAVGLAHHARHGAVRALARLWVRVVRGIPLIVLLLLVHQFASTGWAFGIETSALQSAFLTLTIYASAYFADIISDGIGAIPQQVVDEARLLGAGRRQILGTVTLPWIRRVMGPALVTQAITILKDSSVVVVLGVADLTTNARIALGGDVANAPYWVATYLLVGALYFVAAFGLARIAERWSHGQIRERSVKKSTNMAA